jgi:hypothetical protein
MPSGAVISKDEPTHEKLPSSETDTRARVEGDGMEAHIETSSKDSKATAKEDKTETKEDKPEDASK